tara:strand:+ start:51 stop:266 length:216 start_codon:yes stop_codon:yes gene_type:complete
MILNIEISDDDLARWYFNMRIQPLHEKSGVPVDGIQFMRECYVRDTRQNPNAKKDIKIAFKRAFAIENVIE